MCHERFEQSSSTSNIPSSQPLPKTFGRGFPLQRRLVEAFWWYASAHHAMLIARGRNRGAERTAEGASGATGLVAGGTGGSHFRVAPDHFQLGDRPYVPRCTELASHERSFRYVHRRTRERRRGNYGEDNRERVEDHESSGDDGMGARRCGHRVCHCRDGVSFRPFIVGIRLFRG